MKIILSPSRASIFIIMLIITMVSSNLNWSRNSWKAILEADAKGYYAYLPAVFIYKDLNLGFFEKLDMKKYYNENTFFDYRTRVNGKTINKYYVGTAIAEMPFFLIAHVLSRMLGHEADGYTKLYTVFVSVAAIFYLFLGLIFLNAILSRLFMSEWEKAFILFMLVFGTNLFYYTVGEPGMSHIYSFAFISAFVFYGMKFFSNPQTKYTFIMCLLFGFIVLIRPINGLILLFCPFLAGDYKSLIQGIKFALKSPVILSLSLLSAFLVVFIQSILYKLSCGFFLADSYSNESFHFLAPHMYDILFSYKKGLFLYTPMYLLSLVGLYYMYKKASYLFFSWSVFFIILTYFLSSWWSWYYGGSFSSRVYVDYLVVFVIAFSFAMRDIKRKAFRNVFISLSILILLICQVQTYQYRYFQIHWSEMNKDKYWEVFLRLDKLVK